MLLADEGARAAAGTVLQLDLGPALTLAGSILLALPTSAYFIGKALAAALVGYLTRKDELDRAADGQRDSQLKDLTEAVRTRAESDRLKDEKMRGLLDTMESSRRSEGRELIQSFVDLNKEAIGAIVSMRTDVGGVSQQVTALGGELARFGGVVDRLAATMEHLSDRVEAMDQRAAPRRPAPRGGATPGENRPGEA
jgi:hypothetical protein